MINDDWRDPLCKFGACLFKYRPLCAAIGCMFKETRDVISEYEAFKQAKEAKEKYDRRRLEGPDARRI